MNVKIEALNFIKKFCESHNYDKNTMKWRFPFTSCDLAKHLDEISYSQFKPFIVNNDLE
jgi:hypothetical protein